MNKEEVEFNNGSTIFKQKENSSLRQEVIEKMKKIQMFWENNKPKNHAERILYLTGNHEKQIKTINQVRNWKELVEWHRKYDPNFNEETVQFLMKSYNNKAKKDEEKNELDENHRWMLEFDL